MSLRDWLMNQGLNLLLQWKSRPGLVRGVLDRKDYPKASPLQPGRVRVAAIQQAMYLAPSAAAFTEKTYALARQAVEWGAQLLVFPEYSGAVLLGLLPGLGKVEAGTSLEKAVQELGGEQLNLGDVFRAVAPAAHRIYATTFATLAARFGVAIATGSLIVPDEQGRLFSTQYLYDTTGRLIGKQRKLHLFTSELGWLTPGDELRVFDLPFAKVAIPICMDYTYWETARLAYLQGAEILVNPSFNDDADSNFWRQARGVYTRVQESPAYGIHTYMVGDFLGFHLRGPSLICAPLDLTPQGDGLLAKAQSDTAEEVLLADLDLAALHRYKAEHPLAFNLPLYEKYLPQAYAAYRRTEVGGRRVVAEE
jgi:predicted amidohydrolase